MSIKRRAVGKCYKHILVPLDGSELAELALSHAFDLARLNQAELTLLHILAPIEGVIEGNTPYTIFVAEQQEVLGARAAVLEIHL